MKDESNEKTYTKEDLKITKADNVSRLAPKTVEPKVVNEELSTKECVKISFLVLIGYAMFLLLPTLLITYFFDASFLLTQGVILVIAIIIVFAFGLHKEASPEQLVKRDMHRKL